MENLATTGAPVAPIAPIAPQAPAAPDLHAPLPGAEGTPGETTADLTPKPKETPDEFSARFAALARREKFLRQQQEAIKGDQEKIKGDRERYAAYERAQKDAKNNPIAYLEAAGLSYKEITDYLLNDNKPTPPTTEERLEALQKQVEQDRLDRETQAKTAEEATHERAIESHKADIKSMVDAGGETYELIAANEAYDVVWGVIENYWNKTGTILPMSEAAAHVEGELEKQARRLLQLNKLKPKMEAPQDESPPASPPAAASYAQPPRTLSNAITTGAQPPASSSAWLSEEESKARAAALIRWT